MIDFKDVPVDQLIARGMYSMTRQRREEALKALRGRCEEQNGAVAAILRDVQAGDDTARHMAFLCKGQEVMAELIAELGELSEQMTMLRPTAFPS